MIKIFQNKIMSYTQADVVAVVGKHNLCCGIFKNPCDKQTHFYKYRYRGTFKCKKI